MCWEYRLWLQAKPQYGTGSADQDVQLYSTDSVFSPEESKNICIRGSGCIQKFDWISPCWKRFPGFTITCPILHRADKWAFILNMCDVMLKISETDHDKAMRARIWGLILGISASNICAKQFWQLFHLEVVLASVSKTPTRNACKCKSECASCISASMNVWFHQEIVCGLPAAELTSAEIQSLRNAWFMSSYPQRTTPEC